MKAHETDPVALVFGLLFTLRGAAVLTDRATQRLDVTAITGVAVVVVGLILAVMMIIRLVRGEKG